MGDAVDVGWEGLCDVGDSHAYRFADVVPKHVRHAMTYKKTMRDISGMNAHANGAAVPADPGPLTAPQLTSSVTAGKEQLCRTEPSGSLRAPSSPVAGCSNSGEQGALHTKAGMVP